MFFGAGHIAISQHGEAPETFPETTARVARVRMAATMYAEEPTGSGTWRPVEPPDVEYTHLDRAPKWFPETSDHTSPSRFLNAVIVDLRVQSTDIQ